MIIAFKIFNLLTSSFSGIGHPITSGSPMIDYSIISQKMVPSYIALTQPFILNSSQAIISLSCRSEYETTLQEANKCLNLIDFSMTSDLSNVEDNELAVCRELMGEAEPLVYAEQVVLFDSLGLTFLKSFAK